MRRYETLFIVTPDSSDEDLQAVADKIKGVITGMNGKVASYDEQGKKSLAYNIKKQNRGYYVLMDYLGHAEVVAELERNMRLDDRILKYLTVKLADQVDPATVVAEEPKPRKQVDETEVAAEEPKPRKQVDEAEVAAEEPKPRKQVDETEVAAEEAKPREQVDEAEVAAEEAQSPEVQESEEEEKKEE
ncbi:MAG: 30S ribosomal protein S6 [Deltaproteobacteria bacterium]